MRVGVVGAGLAGLVAAYELAQDGHDVAVYEERDEVGGRVRTVRRDGYVFDHGFQVLFTAYPEARRYLDYDALDLREYDAGAVVASDDGTTVLADPLRSPRDAPASALSDAATFGDKLRLARLRFSLARKERDECFDGDETTTREYLRNLGFSSRFMECFAEPFYGGITLDRSLETSSSVFEFTFSCLSRGRTVVPARGMAAIPEQLARRATDAGAEFKTGVRVRNVTPDAAVETNSEPREHDAVVVATDPNEAERLTDVPTPNGAKSCVTVYLEADEPLGVGKKILLNADARDSEPNHVVPVTAVAPEHAPDGTHVVGATFLGDDDRAADELADSTRAAVARWGFGVSLEPLHVARVPFAQFDQPPGFGRALPSHDAPDGDVVLAGDYTADSSINGAMLSGRRAAETVTSFE